MKTSHKRAAGAAPIMFADSTRTASLGPWRSLAEALRRGKPAAEVQTGLEGLVSSVSRTEAEVSLLELAAEGFGRQDLRKLVQWLTNGGPPAQGPSRNLPAGHPLVMFEQENQALQDRAECYRAAVEGTDAAEAFLRGAAILRQLLGVDNHYRRQEFLLFTRLERHGMVRPGRILWAAHDEVRQWLRYLAGQLDGDNLDARGFSSLADSVVGPFLEDLEWVLFLEDRLLLPLCRRTLDDDDWAEVWEHSPEIGWCLVEPGSEYRPTRSVEPATAPSGPAELPLPTGLVNLETLTAIHGQLPVDLTLVDAEDRVRYFSEGCRPVFYRSRAILGREVRCCHPPRSVHYVEQILSDFKAGREDSAQFWKWMGQRFIHIRFVAIRDPAGAYQGTLEIAQDVTPLKSLEGEQLELRYDRRKESPR